MWTNIFRWLCFLVAGKAAKGQPGETSNAKIQTSKKIQISRIKPEWREERFGDAHWSEYPDVVGEGGQVGVYELDDPTTADSPDRHLAVANHGRFALHRQTTAGVPQTSQSAVSRVSQPADRPLTGRARLLNGLPIGKSAIRQVGKPAVHNGKMPIRCRLRGNLQTTSGLTDNFGMRPHAGRAGALRIKPPRVVGSPSDNCGGCP